MKKTRNLQETRTQSDWLTVTEKSLKIAYWLGKIVQGAKDLGLLDWLN